MQIPAEILTVLRSGPVLVTGGGGFIGRNLVDKLLQLHANVAVLTRRMGPRLAGLEKSIRIIECDLTDGDGLARYVDELRPTVVFHLAAGVAAGTADAMVIQSNVVGTANLLAAVEKHPLRNFVLVGSGFEYGAGERLRESSPLRPLNVYGATKAAAHLLAHSFRRSRGLPMISVRPFTPYGPWEASWRLIPFVIDRALEGATIPLTEGKQERDFVYIDDVVDALLLAVGVVGSDDVEAINICSGEPVTIRQMVSTIVKLTGERATPQFGALEYRKGEMWVQSGDPALARDAMNWLRRTALNDGLHETINWVLANRQLLHKLK